MSEFEVTMLDYIYFGISLETFRCPKKCIGKIA